MLGVPVFLLIDRYFVLITPNRITDFVSLQYTLPTIMRNINGHRPVTAAEHPPHTKLLKTSYMAGFCSPLCQLRSQSLWTSSRGVCTDVWLKSALADFANIQHQCRYPTDQKTLCCQNGTSLKRWTKYRNTSHSNTIQQHHKTTWHYTLQNDHEVESTAL